MFDFYQEMNEYYYRAMCYHSVKNPQEDATSGNHHVINSIYHLLKYRFFTKPISYDENQNDKVRSITFIESTRKGPGLFARHPNKINDTQKHDDYIGILTSSSIMELPYAKEINTVGQKGKSGYLTFKLFGREFSLPFKIKLKYYYDVQNKDSDKLYLDYWFGRFLWFRALAKKAARQEETITLLEKMHYALYMLIGATKKDLNDTSGRILRFIIVNEFKHTKDLNLIYYPGIEFLASIESKYQLGKRDLFGIYYGYDHPFSRVFEEDY